MDSEKKLQAIAAEIIVALHALSSVVRLYDSNNTAVVRQIDTLVETLHRGFADGVNTIRLTLRSDEFFINGQLLKVDVQLYMRAREVGGILEKMNWNDITFVNSTSKEDIQKFVVDFAKCIRKEATAFSSAEFGGISGKKSAGSAAAAFRFDPNKMAIWLVAGLLEVVEKLYVVHESGSTPSLLPVRRSLQLMIDNMQTYTGLYQMLSAFRDPNSVRSQSQKHVSIAIDVIGFGYYLELSTLEILEMSLAAVLSGLSDSSEPYDVIQPVLEFDGLGESAFGMVLLLHDSHAALKGASVSLPGLTLASVMRYHNVIDTDLGIPLPKLIYQLVQEQTVLQGITQIFARYKGPFPIGSFIRVDGETVLVIGQSNRRNGKQRPMVARLHGNQILEIIDLSTSPQREIQSIDSLSGYEHRLEDLELG